MALKNYNIFETNLLPEKHQQICVIHNLLKLNRTQKQTNANHPAIYSIWLKYVNNFAKTANQKVTFGTRKGLLFVIKCSSQRSLILIARYEIQFSCLVWLTRP